MKFSRSRHDPENKKKGKKPIETRKASRTLDVVRYALIDKLPSSTATRMIEGTVIPQLQLQLQLQKVAVRQKRSGRFFEKGTKRVRR